MKVYTTIKVLGKVYRLLDELGLADLLVGINANFNAKALLDSLLLKGKFAEFMQIITKNTETDFEEMDLVEAKEIIADFFTGMAGLLPAPMLSLIKMDIMPEAQPKQALQEA